LRWSLQRRYKRKLQGKRPVLGLEKLANMWKVTGNGREEDDYFQNVPRKEQQRSGKDQKKNVRKCEVAEKELIQEGGTARGTQRGPTPKKLLSGKNAEESGRVKMDKKTVLRETRWGRGAGWGG